MGRRVSRTVVVMNPETGEYTTVVAGDEVPDELEQYVTNEKVWAEEEEFDEETDEALVAVRSANAERTEEDEVNLAEPEEGGSSEFEGMTVPQLRQYAADNNIDLGGATRKEDIVKAISSEG